MSEFINHPMIKENTIQTRLYQQILFAEAIKKDTLIILPTGLGKTIIMVMVIAHYLKNNDKKVVVTAPTRPLVDQHHRTFTDKLDLLEGNIKILSGSSSPKKRAQMWAEARVVIATPQTLRNDIVSGICDLSSISLLCFDEVHRAVGDDPYVLSAEQYKLKNPVGRTLGFTASPRNKEKLLEMVNNLGIRNIKYMDDDDPKVKPYIHGSDEKWIWLEMSLEMVEILKLLNIHVKENLEVLKNIGVIESSSISKLSKKNIINLPPKLNSSRNLIGDTQFFAGMKAYGQLMIGTQAIEMLETQGIATLHSFFDSKKIELHQKSKKSLVSFLNHIAVKKAHILTNDLFKKGINHPKISKLKEIIDKSLLTNKDSRILIFAQYKATINYIVDELRSNTLAKAHRFVGQASSNYGLGLSQKEQKKIMDDFRDGIFNILVSSSVGEEGLDVAQCDLVVFYDITPSSTRLIQRSGRTGRSRRGQVIYLITKKTRDEFYFYSSQRKRKKIKEAVIEVTNELNQVKQNTIGSRDGLNNFFDDLNIESKSNELKEKYDKLSFTKDDETPLIYIDHREKGSSLLRELLKLDVELKQVELPIGDFVISSRVGIERKTIKDFCASIIDNRLFNQLKELKRTYIRPVLIIEGVDISECRISLNAYYAAISTIMIEFNIPTYKTNNQAETISLIHAMVKREMKTKIGRAKIRTPDVTSTIIEEQLSFISSISNINEILAEKLLKHFSTPKKLFLAHPDELKKVHGIGKNIAERIDLLLTTPFEDDELLD